VGSTTDEITSNDLTRVVDAECTRVADGRGIVKGDISATAVKETMRSVAGVIVRPDDLARVVDAVRNGAARSRQRIVEGGEGAAVGIVKEAVVGGTQNPERPDDQAGVVDARCNGEGVGAQAQGI